MGDLSFLFDYISVVILGICLCVGYIVKTAIPTDKINRFIPLIVGLLGLVLSLITNGINEPAILTGLISGLASTGAYELFKNLISNNK